MARARRPILRKGNITSLDEARQKRDAKRDVKRNAEESSSPDTQKRTSLEPEVAQKPVAAKPDAEKPAKAASTTKAAKAAKPKKVGNRTYNKEKVEALKAAIAAGTYQINARRTADKFIERESPA